MKVIDLLNQMRLFDDYRPNVKFKDRVYLYDKCLGNYSCGDYYGLFSGYCIDLILDDEIKIIKEKLNEEQEENKPIQHLKTYSGENYGDDKSLIVDKINELVDKVNELEKRGNKDV